MKCKKLFDFFKAFIKIRLMNINFWAALTAGVEVWGVYGPGRTSCGNPGGPRETPVIQNQLGQPRDGSPSVQCVGMIKILTLFGKTCIRLWTYIEGGLMQVLTPPPVGRKICHSPPLPHLKENSLYAPMGIMHVSCHSTRITRINLKTTNL